MKIEDLIKSYCTWLTDNVKKRIDNGDVGYSWVYKSLEFPDEEVTREEIQKFFDRAEQNDEYEKRYTEEDLSKKEAFAWIQSEINMIYSFHKCFGMRYTSRLQYYRNDLSQKGVRTQSAINISLGRFLWKRESTENDQT
jgi:hypothetical protein